MPDPRVTRYIASAPNVDLFKPALTQLAGFLEDGAKTALLGYGDTAKHLINLFPETVTCVVDERRAGLHFRGVPVVAPGFGLPDGEQLVVCEYERLFDFKQRYVSQAAAKRIPFRFADKYGLEQGAKVIDFIALDPLYQQIFAAAATEAPPTMMSEAGLFGILEQARYCLNQPGDIVEIGAWQGGSAWHIAKMMSLLGSTKPFYTFDMGESLGTENSSAIVCEEEMTASLTKVYPGTRCFFGPAITSLRLLEDRGLAFAFIDFGFNEQIMRWVWDHMIPGGIILMDNYGHTLGFPELFDAFLADRGATAIRSYGFRVPGEAGRPGAHIASPVAFTIKPQYYERP